MAGVTIRVHLLPKLKMSGFETPLRYMPAWRAQGRLRLYVLTELLDFFFFEGALGYSFQYLLA